MAATRKFCEVLSGADIITTITQRAKESGLKLETILKGAGVSSTELAHILDMAQGVHIAQLRDVLRAAGLELCIIESATHAPWQDRHSPTSHPKREAGLYDHHLEG